MGRAAALVPCPAGVRALTDLRIRPAARAVVLDPDDRILLVRFEFPARALWATPGGGIEAGETPEDAIRRELHEEAGLDAFEIGPVVWTRLHIIPFIGGRWDGQREQYHLVRTPAFTPTPHSLVGAAERGVPVRRAVVVADGAPGLGRGVRADAPAGARPATRA